MPNENDIEIIIDNLISQNQKLKATLNIPEYKQMMASLTELSLYYDALTVEDSNGKKKAFKKTDSQKLILLYEECLKNSENFQLVLKTNSSIEGKNAFLSCVEKMQKILNKDANTITNYNFESKMSFDQVITSGRSKIVDISNTVENTVGANSSSRIPIEFKDENGEIRKGFFTREKKFSFYKDFSNALKSDMQDFYQKIDSIPQFTYLDNILKQVNLHKDDTEMLYNLFNDLVTRNEHEETSITKVKKKFIIKHASMFNMFFQYGQCLKSKNDSSITGRNVAMSTVANLLNMPNIIAKSTNMKLKDGNQIYDGVFMENANGLHLGNPCDAQTIFDILHENKAALNNLPLKKSAMNLRILDFICQNMDRHMNNYFYVTDSSNKKIIGLQGIDNDFSFGTSDVNKPFEEGKSSIFTIAFDSLCYITKDASDSINALSSEQLKLSLVDTGLKKEEIDACCKRLDMVKEAIKSNKIIVLNDDELKKTSIKEIAKNIDQKNKALTKDSKMQYYDLFTLLDQNTKSKARKNKKQFVEQITFTQSNLSELYNQDYVKRDLSYWEELDIYESKHKKALKKAIRSINTAGNDCINSLDDDKKNDSSYLDIQNAGYNYMDKLRDFISFTNEIIEKNDSSEKNNKDSESIIQIKTFNHIVKNQLKNFKTAFFNKIEKELEENQIEFQESILENLSQNSKFNETALTNIHLNRIYNSINKMQSQTNKIEDGQNRLNKDIKIANMRDIAKALSANDKDMLKTAVKCLVISCCKDISTTQSLSYEETVKLIDKFTGSNAYDKLLSDEGLRSENLMNIIVNKKLDNILLQQSKDLDKDFEDLFDKELFVKSAIDNSEINQEHINESNKISSESVKMTFNEFEQECLKDNQTKNTSGSIKNPALNSSISKLTKSKTQESNLSKSISK